MNRNKTIDLKKYGIIEDLREGKESKGSKRRIYYEKPSFEKYKKEVSKTEDKNLRKELYKEQKKQEQKYVTQQAQIRLGSIPSKNRERVERIAKNVGKYIDKKLKERVISRKILKPNKIQVHIKERNPENVWEKQNMFFKGNYEKEKRSMFFE